MCVCFGSHFGCAPPLLAGVLGCVCVCAWAQVSAAPRDSSLGCWGVCVFVCPLRLFPATPGLGVWCGCVCLGSGFGCAPPLLAGVLGCVCVCVPTPLVPCHSWLGFAAWVCVLGLGFRLRPCHSWLRCWGVCVFVCPLSLFPAARGCGVGVCVCVLRLGFRLRPATPGWAVGVCVCLCARSACSPPPLAGVCGLGVCAWAQVSAVPRHSWLGCWGVCVLVCALRLFRTTVWLGCAEGVLRALRLRFRLRPATPGWGVGVCVCLCARSACSPPLLAGVC